MRRQRLIFSVAIAAGLVVVVALVFVFNQDADRYREQVAALLSDAAGYPVRLEGPMRLDWRPSPALTVADAVVAAPGARVTLGSVKVSVNPTALLARRFRAESVEVRELRVDLRSGEFGDGPLMLPEPAALSVRELVVNDVVVSRDGVRLFTVTRASLHEPAAARGARVDVDFTVAGQRLDGKTRLRVAPGRLEFDELVLHTSAGVVEGRLSLALGGARPRLGGALTADALSFAPAGDSAAARIFPQLPLDLAALEAVDGAVRVTVGRLSLSAVRVTDITIPVTLRDGRLEASGRGIYAGGSAGAMLDVSAADAAWKVDVRLEGADAGDALVMLGVTGAESGGRMDADAALTASGDHTRDILASMAGRVSFDVSEVKLRAGAARLGGSDVLASITRSLRGDSGDRLAVECAVARFAVSEGLLTSRGGIAGQSRTVNLLGSGRISLPDEHLELVFQPWPREGRGLSASAVFGTVAISGPLADPEVALTGDAAWREGATAGAAEITGGLSLIAQGLLELARGDAPCAQAREQGAPPGAGGRSAGEFRSG